VPVYACAPGKAILAFSDDVSQEAVLRSPLKQFTPATHATRDDLARELEKIRRDGFALNRGEFYDNGRLAVAAPILDHDATPVAAVCFYGPTDESSIQRLIEPLLQLGQVLSSSLGYNRAYHELVG
jgi:DNA-binding IclR family transcriptional regulator